MLYSQFRTIEGIGIFSLVLKANGFIQFKLVKNSSGQYILDIPEGMIVGQRMFALYTGTESAEEKELMANAPFSQAAYCEALGIKDVDGEKGYTTLERATVRPTLDVNGIWGGYTGEGAKTVIASKAFAKIFNNFLSKTPTTCFLTRAGLLSGPIILNIVLLPIFFLVGPTNLIAL